MYGETETERDTVREVRECRERETEREAERERDAVREVREGRKRDRKRDR